MPDRQLQKLPYKCFVTENFPYGKADNDKVNFIPRCHELYKQYTTLYKTG